jgi:hypothetical protein
VSITEVSDGTLPDVSAFTLGDLLDLTADVSTALRRILEAPADCANSFQSSI